VGFLSRFKALGAINRIGLLLWEEVVYTSYVERE
jgi:hypothetical protein